MPLWRIVAWDHFLSLRRSKLIRRSCSTAASSKKSHKSTQARERASPDPTTLRRELDEIGKEISISRLEDWYNVHRISHRGIMRLLRSTGLGIDSLLTTAYPEHEWLTWKFDRVPHRFWNSVVNQRRFLEWALNHISPDASDNDLSKWYDVRKIEIKKLGGTRLLNMHGDSLQNTLAAVYPQHKFLPWKFRAASRNYWRDAQNHRRFFEHLAASLGWALDSPEPWYNITIDLVSSYGGSNLLQNYYRNSASSAVMHVFPEHTWQPWRFHACPKGFWDVPSNQKRFVLEGLIPKIWSQRSKQDPPRELTSQLEMLYSVTHDEIVAHGGASLYNRFYSVVVMCQSVFPDHSWDLTKFQRLGR